MVQCFKPNFLNDDIYCVGTWNLHSPANFPKRRYLSADTETKLFFNHYLSDDEAYMLYKERGQQWCKENIEVIPYALMLSDGKDFVLAQNVEDFLTLCAMFNVKRVFWYNAKFDFAIFDYYFLTNNWKLSDDEVKDKETYSHLSDKTYQSLDGEFGQRYQLRIWKKYLNRNYKEVVTEFKFIDVCNIFGGGLARNLNDWDIRDENGNKVRKLTMDYASASIKDDLQYMINDTKGLHLLAEKIDKTIFDLCGFSLFKGDYITAGGLAKKTLLEKMFKQGSQSKNVKKFRHFFPISIEEDEDFRKHKLYLGGKCLVNPYKQGIPQQGVYKYDVNSMYPAQMRKMLYPVGFPRHTKILDIKPNKVYILKVRNLTGLIKPNKIPIYPDSLTGEYKPAFLETKELYFWLDELEELKHWYYLNYDIVDILEYDGKHPKGAIEYIDLFYGVKSTSKGAIKNGAKLFLNSAYGKLAQRTKRMKCKYKLQLGGYVALVKEGVEEDEKGMLSVVVGSRITALARVCLMEYIRKICNENVKAYFIYCDTDSVHALKEFKDTDDKELGKMKFEGYYNKAIYLAPKSYLLYNEQNNEYEVHCKGVNTNVVKSEIENLPFDEAIKVFAPNRTFKCLMGLNVKGGKALIYVDKMIVNEKNIIKVREMLGDLEEIQNAY